MKEIDFDADMTRKFYCDSTLDFEMIDFQKPDSWIYLNFKVAVETCLQV